MGEKITRQCDRCGSVELYKGPKMRWGISPVRVPSCAYSEKTLPLGEQRSIGFAGEVKVMLCNECQKAVYETFREAISTVLKPELLAV